jgi:hypothetical protein
MPLPTGLFDEPTPQPKAAGNLPADLFGPAPSDGWQDTPYGFKVKPLQIGNVQTVQRDDGAAFFGPQQGNKGAPGWFNAQGQRVGNTPTPEGAPTQSWMGQGVSSLLGPGATIAQALAHRVMGEHGTNPTVGGVAHGVASDVVAPAQLAAHVVGSSAVDPLANRVESYFGSGDKGGQMLGQAAPFLMTGGAAGASPEAATGPLSAAQKIKAILATIGKSAATGAVAAPAMTMETSVQGPDDFWARKASEAKMGAATGGVLSGAGEAVGGLVSKMKAPLPPEAQAIQDLGDKFGVRTLAPDLATNQPGLAKTAVLAESVPGSGMVAQRVAQQAEARAAAQKLLEQHGIEGDVSTTIQQGLANKLAEAKASASDAYNTVGKLAEGKGDVPLDQTLAAIQKAKAAESSAVVPDQGLVGLLGKMEDRIQSPEVDTTFNGVRGLRSDLGSMISDYYKGTNAATGSKGVQVLQGIKGALEGDLQNFTSTNGPEIAQAAKKADSIYKNQVVPFKDQIIAKAVKSSEPDQIFKTIVAAGPDRAQKFYNAMDTNGQAAVRSQMVKNAMDAATQQDGVFSPTKFAQSLEKVKDQTGVFFKGQDKFELDGFTNLMRHVQRAGQINENPTNGQRLIQGLILGEGGGAALGAMAGHPAAFAAPAASMGAARAFTALVSSNAGKKLLLSASDLAPSSPALENLISEKLPRILAVTSAKTMPGMVPAMASQPSASNPEIAQTEQK